MELSKFQEDLVLQHMQAANKIAHAFWRTAPHVLDLDDLKSTAYKGLVEAASRWPSYCEKRKFDPNATQFFYKFSSLRMKGAIIDSMRTDDWATRALRQRSRKLRDAGQDRGASVEEMSVTTGMSEKDIHETLHDMSKRPVSLEAEEIDTPVVQSVESSVLVGYLLEVLVSVIKRFDLVTQTILALHYYQGRELQDIAKILGITEHRSSELHTNSVILIRKALEDATIGKNPHPSEE